MVFGQWLRRSTPTLETQMSLKLTHSLRIFSSLCICLSRLFRVGLGVSSWFRLGLDLSYLFDIGHRFGCWFGLAQPRRGWRGVVG